MPLSPSKRYLIFSLDTGPKRYIGLQFFYIRNPLNIKFDDKQLTTNLNSLLRRYKIDEIEPEFPNYYKSVHQELLDDPLFKQSEVSDLNQAIQNTLEDIQTIRSLPEPDQDRKPFHNLVSNDNSLKESYQRL